MEYNGLTKDFTNIFKSDGGCYTLSLGWNDAKMVDFKKYK